MKIAVVGSLNKDLVAQCHTLPRPGETLSGKTFATHNGGKGANQAVGCARLGGDVAMIGCIGADNFGKSLKHSLSESGVDTQHLITRTEAATGCALITLSESQNTIVVIPGANGLLDPTAISSARSVLSTVKVLLMQLEVPVAANITAAKIVRKSGGIVILDPAPAVPLDRNLLDHVDFITPNQTEAEALLGHPVRTREDAERAVREFEEKWHLSAIIKLGSEGACHLLHNRIAWVPPFPVKAVDTVAAGDAFTAGLAVALSEERPLAEAVQWASAAGALCVTRSDAQEAMPRRTELETLLSQHQVAAFPSV